MHLLLNLDKQNFVSLPKPNAHDLPSGKSLLKCFLDDYMMLTPYPQWLEKLMCEKKSMQCSAILIVLFHKWTLSVYTISYTGISQILCLKEVNEKNCGKCRKSYVMVNHMFYLIFPTGYTKSSFHKNCWPLHSSLYTFLHPSFKCHIHFYTITHKLHKFYDEFQPV